jgi:sortase A
MTALEGTELGRPVDTGPSPTPGPPPAPVPSASGAPAPAGGPALAPGPVGRPMTPARAVSLGICLLGVFLLGFAFYLFALSGVQEARSQTTLYTRLQNELAAGTAPTGTTTPGSPVAVMSIPSIGLNDAVVVEGTSPEDLTLGPGHLRNSPLPGQTGTSVIYGRRATFGAPFANLGSLSRGDIIRVTTAQGTSSYEVVAFGSSSSTVEDPSASRLILLTAASAAVPTYYGYVDADLVSNAKSGPGILSAIYPDETALSSDGGALVLTALWAIALALFSAIATVAALRWSAPLAYLCAAPVVLAILWNLYENLAALLPNVY